MHEAALFFYTARLRRVLRRLQFTGRPGTSIEILSVRRIRKFVLDPDVDGAGEQDGVYHARPTPRCER
ncbi:MAG TPA: hypothetical protein VKB39_07290, partial [Candidatus Baltobacteraceae bacterium]|nr:hypothetical protein [Candidatus Baltobacteraceae bacterium]